MAARQSAVGVATASTCRTYRKLVWFGETPCRSDNSRSSHAQGPVSSSLRRWKLSARSPALSATSYAAEGGRGPFADMAQPLASPPWLAPAVAWWSSAVSGAPQSYPPIGSRCAVKRTYPFSLPLGYLRGISTMLRPSPAMFARFSSVDLAEATFPRPRSMSKMSASSAAPSLIRASPKPTLSTHWSPLPPMPLSARTLQMSPRLGAGPVAVLKARYVPPCLAAWYTSLGSTPPVNLFHPRVVIDTSVTSTVTPLHRCPPPVSIRPKDLRLSNFFGDLTEGLAPPSNSLTMPLPFVLVSPRDPTRMPSMPKPLRSSMHRSARKWTAMSTLCCGAFVPRLPSRHACRQASYARTLARSSPRQGPR